MTTREDTAVETLGRFGHHPDPAIDFEVEVDCLIGMAYNRRTGDKEPELEARVEKAMAFRVGGDPSCIAAKGELRKIDAELRATLSQPVPGVPTHRHKKRGTEYILLGIGKMQAEMWLEQGEGTIDSPSPLEPIDMREVAIYRSIDDGSLWVRPREEFEDGRFAALTTQVPSAGGGEP